jgi:hypothetical protein
MERWEELASDYLDGDLDDAGRQELARLIESDPERLRKFVDLVRESRILSVELGEPQADAFSRKVMSELNKNKSAFVRSVMSAVRDSGTGAGPGRPRPVRAGTPGRRRPTRGPGTGFPWIAWGALAAGAALIVAVLLLALGSSGTGERAVVRGEGPRAPRPIPSAPPRDPSIAPPPVVRSPEAPVPAPTPRPAPVPDGPNGVAPAPTPVPAPAPVPPAPPKSPETPPGPVPAAPPTRVLAATLERVEGTVSLTSGPASRPAQGAEALEAGFALATEGEPSFALLRFPDGTSVEVRGGSRLRDLSVPGGRRLGIEGAIWADVAKQPQDQPLVFVTPQAEAKILGTKLRILTLADSTRLDVAEGKVKLTRIKDRQSVDVASGHYAIAAPGVPLTSRLARVSWGQQVLYTFREGRGPLVHDVSRAGVPIDLKLDSEPSVRWSAKGLLLAQATMARSIDPATRLVRACQASQEISVEVWFRPAAVPPASKDGRIFTLSADTLHQDFMIGQEDSLGPPKSYFVRLRTTATDLVGKPALESPEGASQPRLTHLVYTRSSAGVATLYLDGAEVARSTVGGDLSAWDDTYRLGLGNEHTNDRPWLGELHLAAVYSRALSADEVKQNLRAGAE